MNGNRRGFFVILGGTAGGQAVVFLAAPALARVYEPTHWGIFTVLYSLVMLVGAVSALRFELAVPLPKREAGGHAVAALGLATSLFLGALGTLAVGLGRSRISDVLPQADLDPWLWLVPLSASLAGIYLVLNQLAVRQRRFASIGRRNAIQSIVTVASQLLLGAAGVRPGGLILGFCIGQIIGIVALLPGSGIAQATARQARSRASILAALRRYRRFPLLLAPAGLLNVAGLQVPILLIAYFYGSSVAGWFGLTQRVLWLPVLVIGTAVGQVYLSELAAARHLDTSAARRLFGQASRRLVIVGAVAVLALLFFGPGAFSLVFGDQWTESGHYARALALTVGAQLVAAPLSHTLVVFERHFLQLALDLGRLTAVSGAVVACQLSGGSARDAVWALGFCSAGSYGVGWLLSRSTVRAIAKTPEPRPYF